MPRALAGELSIIAIREMTGQLETPGGQRVVTNPLLTPRRCLPRSIAKEHYMATNILADRSLNPPEYSLGTQRLLTRQNSPAQF